MGYLAKYASNIWFSSQVGSQWRNLSEEGVKHCFALTQESLHYRKLFFILNLYLIGFYLYSAILYLLYTE